MYFFLTMLNFIFRLFIENKIFDEKLLTFKDFVLVDRFGIKIRLKNLKISETGFVSIPKMQIDQNFNLFNSIIQIN